MVQANGKAQCLILYYATLTWINKFPAGHSSTVLSLLLKTVPSVSNPWGVQRSYQSRESKGCMFSSSFLSMRFNTVGSTTDWDLEMKRPMSVSYYQIIPFPSLSFLHYSFSRGCGLSSLHQGIYELRMLTFREGHAYSGFCIRGRKQSPLSSK